MFKPKSGLLGSILDFIKLSLTIQPSEDIKRTQTVPKETTSKITRVVDETTSMCKHKNPNNAKDCSFYLANDEVICANCGKTFRI